MPSPDSSIPWTDTLPLPGPNAASRLHPSLKAICLPVQLTDDARTSQKKWGEIRPPEEKTALGINNRPARIGNQPVNHLAADQVNNIWALATSLPDDAH
jgi:hypothetical protein